MTKKNHPFHLVDPSPWPITGSMGAFSMASGMVMWFHMNNPWLLMLGSTITLLTMYQWWRDVCREGTFQGHHTKKVVINLKLGMILFITSEIFFFLAFFWAFFHSSLSPSIEIGNQWPPAAITPFNPMEMPLLNTIILLTSGMTVTWCHHSMMNSKSQEASYSLVLTIILGIMFTVMQMIEYQEAPFCISDSVYGSTFFMATGFHGVHVIVGTTFLSVCLMRHFMNHFSKTHHLGFEAAAWYWHFVDVVWLFLYVSIYWWGS
uniref:Cytochrome c oxidase subunit 3 n=1 Tax=Aradacanthia heissi TaxID=928818 RepID=I6LNM1_9HEMI|nr:cytochrome c oxidase subunit III [Aradacanthia heissi]